MLPLAMPSRLAAIAPTLVAALANRANAYALCGGMPSASVLKGLKARGRAPSAVLEKDVWASVEGLPETRAWPTP